MKRFCLIFAFIMTVGSLVAGNGGNPFPSETCFYAEGVCAEAAGNDSSQLTVYVEGTRLYTVGLPDGTILSIYSITGQRLGMYTVMDNYVDLGDALPKGIYIVRADNRSAKITIRG